MKKIITLFVLLSMFSCSQNNEDIFVSNLDNSREVHKYLDGLIKLNPENMDKLKTMSVEKLKELRSKIINTRRKDSLLFISRFNNLTIQDLIRCGVTSSTNIRDNKCYIVKIENGRLVKSIIPYDQYKKNQ